MANYSWKNIAWDKSYNDKWYYNGATTSLEECFLKVFNIKFRLEGPNSVYFYPWKTNDGIPYIEMDNGRKIVLTLPYEADKIRFRKSGSDNNGMIEVAVENKVATISGQGRITIWFGEIGIAKEFPYYYGFKQGGYDLYYNKGDTSIITTKYNTNNPRPAKQSLKSSTWSSIVSVPNYGIEGKSLHGVDSINWTDNKTKIFKYTTAYNNKILTPYVWELVNRHVFICYSNFNGCDNWGVSSYYSSSGNAETLYYIDGNFWGEDSIVEASAGNNWWTQSPNRYSLITKNNNIVGWSIKKYDQQCKKIKTYTESDSILIIEYTGKQLTITNNTTTKTYDMSNYSKIIIAKRDLVSLQEKFEDTSLIRFFMCYADHPTATSRRVNLIAANKWPNNPSSHIWYSTEKENYMPDDYTIKTGSSDFGGYIKMYQGNSFTELGKDSIQNQDNTNIPEQVIDIDLPNIEYFDITEYIQVNKRVCFPKDLNAVLNDTKVTQMDFTNGIAYSIENSIGSKSYYFDFSNRIPDDKINGKNVSCYYHGAIKYKINVNNIKTLGIGQLKSSQINLIQEFETANMEHGSNAPGATYSSSVLVQNYYKWSNVPNWFKEHFVDFSLGILFSLAAPNAGYYEERYDEMEKWAALETKEDGRYGTFTCSGSVTGWANWEAEGYKHLIPATTALNAGNDLYFNNPTWYAHRISIYNPYSNFNSLWPIKGIQMGYTTGISINYNDIDAVSLNSDNQYTVPENEMPSIGVLLMK